MTRKINLLTVLIFAYSIIVCLTCKRDFSHEFSKDIQPVNEMKLVSNSPLHVLPAQQFVVTSIAFQYLSH